MNIAQLHERFAAPSQWTCMRLRLRELTVGHYEIMEAMGCELPTRPDDLATAALICSMPYQDWPRARDSIWLNLGLWIWGRSLGAWSFAGERDAFHRYLEHNLAGPVFATRGDSAQSDAPLSAYVRVKLCRFLGHDPMRVAEYPMRRALWDLTVLEEMRDSGVIRPEPSAATAARVEAELPSIEECRRIWESHNGIGAQ